MKRAIACAAAASVVLLAAGAGAHEVGLSRGDYVVKGANVKAEVVFARKEIIGLVAGLDADHDGAITPAELAAARGSIEGALVGRIHVKGDGVPCAGTIDRADLTEGDGASVRATYRCARRPRRLTVELGFLDDLAFGHRHLARATAGTVVVDQVLSQRSPSLSIDVPPGAEPAPPVAEAGTSPLRRGFLHVLAPPLAPAFLLALLATCAGRRSAILAAAAFSLAVAVGLALGALGWFMPAPSVLGPAIAVSLVYAGLEAVGSPDGHGRWRVAIPFGVVHGLGCAAACPAGGLGAPTGDPVATAAFGAGVGLGLLLSAAAIEPAIALARGKQALAGRRVAVLGAAIAALGVLGIVALRL